MEPVIFPEIPNPEYDSFVPPGPDELSLMFEAAIHHIKRVIIIGAYFGVRMGECELLQLTWDDVYLKRIVLRVHGSRKNHNATWREVPIRQNLKEVFERWYYEDQQYGANNIINHKNHKGQAICSIKKAWKICFAGRI